MPDVLFPSVMEGLTNERVTTARVNTLAATMDQLKAEFSAHDLDKAMTSKFLRLAPRSAVGAEFIERQLGDGRVGGDDQILSAFP